jgi:DNA polymerase III epsilon subunit-like protein
MAKKVVKKAAKKVAPKKVAPKKKIKEKKGLSNKDITQEAIDEAIKEFKDFIKPGMEFATIVFEDDGVNINGAHSQSTMIKLALSILARASSKQ